MLGVILTAAATLLEELSASIGKLEMKRQAESVMTYAVLTLIWVLVFFIILVFFGKATFVFSLASLPIFIPRVFLEIIQVYFTTYAIKIADRTTSSFLRIGTAPLLLLVDLVLGYKIGLYQSFGIFLILLTFIFIFTSRKIDKTGIWLVILGTLNAVITISLYKYDISHFNSVAAEQIMVHSILVIYFFFAAFIQAKENPLRLLTKKIYLAQSFSDGVGGVLESFAYSFAPASVILTAKRAFAVIWATVSGEMYFREKYPIIKMILVALLIIGVALLIL